MNLRQFFVSVFTGNQTSDGLEAVRESARNDAREIATAYADEFTAEVANVLSERLTGFREDGVIVIEQPPVKKIGRKNAK
jgi:hypothetical protein